MRQIALGILVTGLISTSAWAQEPTQPRLVTSGALAGIRFDAPALTEQTPPATPAPAPAKKVTGTFLAEVPSSYFFRGYRQETDPNLTFQPSIDIAVAGEKASYNVGLFNSFHTGSLKDAGYGYYETDFYAAVTMGKIKTTYTAYTYPKIDSSLIQELMFSGSFGGKAAASVALAFELQKSSGADKGIYLELGVNPAVPMKDGAPVVVTIPVKLGLSMKDYYGDGAGFGYVSGGVNIAKPLSHGDVHGSVTVYGFGDTLKAVNNGNSAQVVGLIGFTAIF
jgi:hypothetical protein